MEKNVPGAKELEELDEYIDNKIKELNVYDTSAVHSQETR